MTKSDSPTTGRARLRPRARLLRTLGDELISSATVAVIELVKNAYDADATHVLVRFSSPLDIGTGQIEVIDNGHGMSLEALETVWMEPASLFKRRNPLSEGGRRVLGEKGIGRFAASRLADHLEVVTRRASAELEVYAFFDWSQFDREDAYLQDVSVPWEVRLPVEVRPGGTIEELWRSDGVVQPPPTLGEPDHGTIRRMTALRASWGRAQLEELRTGLSRLVLPMPATGVQQVAPFGIRLVVPDTVTVDGRELSLQDLSGPIEPPETLENPHYLLKGHVDAAGDYDLTLRLRGRDDEIHLQDRFHLKETRPPLCGPFDLELRVWDRDQPSMLALAYERETTVKDVRGDLDRVAGVNVYRDGFRVLPYGESRNDWLRLDHRRVQNPTLRLSNNQIVGFVLISADRNPLLRDQSNREGLIEGPALDDLREFVVQALSLLEERRYRVRERRSPRPSTGIFAGFDLVAVRSLVRQRYPHDTELLALVGETEKDLERRVEEVQQVLARYRRLATLGQLVDTVLHDGRTPLAKIQTESYLGARDVQQEAPDGSELFCRLRDRFGTLTSQANVLATVFRRLEPFGGRRRGRPAEVALEQVIADAFAVVDSEVKELGVGVTLPDTDTRVRIDTAEIQEVIVNLLQNSLYWLRQVPKERRRISVAVNRVTANEVLIVFADSGPGVAPEHRDLIFDPYFSTKPDGIGLGLAIAGEIVSEYYAGALELVDSGPLPGATFRITLRRRV